MEISPTSNSKHDSTVNLAKRPKVLIVGAGLAGLTLALLLQKANIPYEVFERAQESKPLGNNNMLIFVFLFCHPLRSTMSLTRIFFTLKRFCYCVDIADIAVDSTTWTRGGVQFSEQGPYYY